MSRYLPTTWLLAAAFVVTLGCLGQELDDNSDEASAADDAIAQIKRENHIVDVGKKVCGEGAAWQIDGNTLQCFTHQGKPTITAQVKP